MLEAPNRLWVPGVAFVELIEFGWHALRLCEGRGELP